MSILECMIQSSTDFLWYALDSSQTWQLASALVALSTSAAEILRPCTLQWAMTSTTAPGLLAEMQLPTSGHCQRQRLMSGRAGGREGLHPLLSYLAALAAAVVQMPSCMQASFERSFPNLKHDRYGVTIKRQASCWVLILPASLARR